MRIIAFDPGGTTGWVSHTLFMDKITNPRVDISKSVTYGALVGNHNGELYHLIRNFNPDIIVSERFDYQIRVAKDGTERQKIDLVSKEYIGIMRMWADITPKCIFIEQGQMKDGGGSFWSDDKLDSVGMLTDEDSLINEHINDAKRQLLSYIVFGAPKRVDYLKLLRR